MDTCMRKEGLDYEADVGDLFGRPGVSLGLEPPRDLGGSSRWHTALPLWLAPEKQPRASSAPHARGQASLSPASTQGRMTATRKQATWTLEQACLSLAQEPESDRGCPRGESREDQLSKMSPDCPVGEAEICRDGRG